MSLHYDGDDGDDEAEEKEASHLTRRRLAEKARPARGKAEEMLARAHGRGKVRITSTERPDSRKKDLIARGFYITASGPVTVGYGGQTRQMIVQTKKEFYNDETLDPHYPTYSSVKAHLPDVRALYDPEWKPPEDTPALGRAAASAGAAMVNVSEPYFAPASDKFVRSLAKRHAGNPKAPHPLDEAVNPAVGEGGHERMAALMSGETALNEDQRAAIEEWSDSSAAEDDPFATRSGILKTDPTRTKRPNNNSNNDTHGKKRKRE
jgi:hypothetical protein